MKNKWIIIVSLFLIFVAMWVLNMLTPEFIDDFWYKFKFIQEELYTTDPVTSFKEVVISQYNHYFNINGRVIVHTAVQMFTGIWGKAVFNIFNAAVFALFIYLLARCSGKRVTALNILFTFAVVLFLFPELGTTMLWMTGSVNYLWSSTVVCAFLLAAERLKDMPLRTKHLLWGVLSVFVGWTHEGIAFPLAISLVVYVFTERKTIFTKAVFPLIVGFVVGALLCSLAPSTLSRANADSGISLYMILQKINSGLTVCLKLRLFYVFLLCAVAAMCYAGKGERLQWLKEFYAKNIIVFNAMVLSFGVVFVSGFMSTRTGIGVELFSLILLLRIIQSLEVKNMNAIKVSVGLCSCILYGCILFWSVPNYRNSQSIIAQTASGESDIVVYENSTAPSFISSYIIKNTCLYMFRADGIWNILLADIFHHEKLAFIPAKIYNDIITHSENIADIGKQKDYPLYVVPADGCTGDLLPLFVLNPVDYDSLPFYIRPFASRFERYSATEVPTERFCILNIDGRDYVFIEKNMMIDYRVEDIRLSVM